MAKRRVQKDPGAALTKHSKYTTYYNMTNGYKEITNWILTFTKMTPEPRWKTQSRPKLLLHQNNLIGTGDNTTGTTRPPRHHVAGLVMKKCRLPLGSMARRNRSGRPSARIRDGVCLEAICHRNVTTCTKAFPKQPLRSCYLPIWTSISHHFGPPR